MYQKSNIIIKKDNPNSVEIDKTLDLFRNLIGKDVFFEAYRRCLARRLLDVHSFPEENEQYVINELQVECGKISTKKIEAMISDIKNSVVINQKFKSVF